MASKLSRRSLLTGIALTAGSLAGVGAFAAALVKRDQLSQNGFRPFLTNAEDLTRTTQRFFLHPTSMAREFSEADIAPKFRANGTTMPDSEEYAAMVANNFADWKLKISGLVETPMEFSLADLRAMPSRTQITRHDCVEGWSCIGKWKGVQLALVLDKVKLKPEAKYLVFICADELEKTLDGTGRYYESHGLEDAFHPQTILAYELNGETLPVPHGAPVRLRVERQLGYKQPKYIMEIQAVDGLAKFGTGNGGFWEDRGYEWYGGI
jgi:DMSO/TMAO reductase YedYZ molybdopterin-dependent catalytic subunit